MGLRIIKAYTPWEVSVEVLGTPGDRRSQVKPCRFPEQVGGHQIFTCQESPPGNPYLLVTGSIPWSLGCWVVEGPWKDDGKFIWTCFFWVAGLKREHLTPLKIFQLIRRGRIFGWKISSMWHQPKKFKVSAPWRKLIKQNIPMGFLHVRQPFSTKNTHKPWKKSQT